MAEALPSLMMEAVHSSETSVYFNETVRCHTPESNRFILAAIET
jgi:hypothetical protein